MIYVIRGPHDYVKVGISGDPLERLATLQTASPVPLQLVYCAAVKSGDATAVEQAVHATLQRHWQAGEWFDVAPELAIGAIAAASYRLGDPIVEIARENVRYVVDRAKAEALAEAKPKRHWVVSTLLWMLVLSVVWVPLGLALLIFYLAGRLPH